MPDALHIKCVVFRIITLHSSIDSMVELLVASRNTFNRRVFLSFSFLYLFFLTRGILKRKIEGEKAQKARRYLTFISPPFLYALDKSRERKAEIGRAVSYTHLTLPTILLV